MISARSQMENSGLLCIELRGNCWLKHNRGVVCKSLARVDGEPPLAVSDSIAIPWRTTLAQQWPCGNATNPQDKTPDSPPS